MPACTDGAFATVFGSACFPGRGGNGIGLIADPLGPPSWAPRMLTLKSACSLGRPRTGCNALSEDVRSALDLGASMMFPLDEFCPISRLSRDLGMVRVPVPSGVSTVKSTTPSPSVLREGELEMYCWERERCGEGLWTALGVASGRDSVRAWVGLSSWPGREVMMGTFWEGSWGLA